MPAAAKNSGVGFRTKNEKKGVEIINGTLVLNFLFCFVSYPESDEKIDNIFISVPPVQREVQDVISPA